MFFWIITMNYFPPAQRCRGCPNGWSRIHRRCFLYVPRAMNWATAEVNFSYFVSNTAIKIHVSPVVTLKNCSVCHSSLKRNCLSMGANLASVHTSAEHQLIQRLTAHNGYGVTWVGGTDASGVFFFIITISVLWYVFSPVFWSCLYICLASYNINYFEETWHHINKI